MAPPSIRRTGFSKRAQYGIFYAYIAGFLGVVVGAGFLLVSLFNPDAFSGLRGFAADRTAPVGRVVAAGRGESQSVFATIGGFLTSGSRTARLESEVELARVKLAEAQDLRAENARLHALLGIAGADPRPLTVARLIASTPGSTRRFATISVGRDQGVQPGMPVRSPLGLVGRVLEVSQKTSQVLLVTDSESTVPVRRARDGVDAFAQGHGDGTLLLRLINLGINPLHPGDVMVTSGSGGLYRPGIAVAVVSQITHDGAIARILSDPSASEFVVVDQPWTAATGMPQPTGPARTAKVPTGKP